MTRGTAMNDGRRRPPPAAPRSAALKEVRALLGGDSFPGCESPSLRLEKFVRIGGNVKKGEIDAVVTCSNEHARPIPLFAPKDAVTRFAKLESRLIVNQAGGILLNAGLCIHPHYGTPFIPGSAVKGVARHAAWCEWKEAFDAGDEKKALATAETLATVFGYPTEDDGLDEYLARNGRAEERRRGSVAFLPALPLGKVPLAVDIVNCHHMDYYTGNGRKPQATDDESPNPQFFPAIEKGAIFAFTLVPIEGGDVEQAWKWLRKAIELHGVGAKTAAGYGWFLFDEEADRKKHEQLLQEEQAADEAERLEEIRKELERLDDGSREPFPEETRQRIEELEKTLGTFRHSTDAVTKTLEKIRFFRNNRWPRETPRDKLLRANDKEFSKNYVAKFDRQPEEMKAAIVLFLREDDGAGHDRWQALRAGQKGDIAKGVDAIRKYSKDTLKLGKMP